MVLICNNGILTIDTFHKHRCEEKTCVRDILIDLKYNKETFRETPAVEREPSRSLEEFLASVKAMDGEPIRPIRCNRR